MTGIESIDRRVYFEAESPPDRTIWTCDCGTLVTEQHVGFTHSPCEDCWALGNEATESGCDFSEWVENGNAQHGTYTEDA